MSNRFVDRITGRILARASASLGERPPGRTPYSAPRSRRRPKRPSSLASRARISGSSICCRVRSPQTPSVFFVSSIHRPSDTTASGGTTAGRSSPEGQQGSGVAAEQVRGQTFQVAVPDRSIGADDRHPGPDLLLAEASLARLCLRCPEPPRRPYSRRLRPPCVRLRRRFPADRVCRFRPWR